MFSFFFLFGKKSTPDNSDEETLQSLASIDVEIPHRGKDKTKQGVRFNDDSNIYYEDHWRTKKDDYKDAMWWTQREMRQFRAIAKEDRKIIGDRDRELFVKMKSCRHRTFSSVLTTLLHCRQSDARMPRTFLAGFLADSDLNRVGLEMRLVASVMGDIRARIVAVRNGVRHAHSCTLDLFPSEDAKIQYVKLVSERISLPNKLLSQSLGVALALAVSKKDLSE